MALESSLKSIKGTASTISSVIKANMVVNTLVSVVTFGPIWAILNSVKQL